MSSRKTSEDGLESTKAFALVTFDIMYHVDSNKRPLELTKVITAMISVEQSI